ncbi:hypothetical protein CQA76_07455 [Campylobacter aviculae]|uniref:Uncharacterized protein n=1 Tax=Campylobacter aviculae TaxID=2510190 RepID=A0A4U7BQ05_9BACT|nr:hypothetical protein CQA76_07455 [Campylobacter aviculae]
MFFMHYLSVNISELFTMLIFNKKIFLRVLIYKFLKQNKIIQKNTYIFINSLKYSLIIKVNIIFISKNWNQISPKTWRL